VVHEEPDLGGVPDALAPLVYACLAKDPETRPSTVQLSERLSEIAAREARGIGAPRREGLPKAAGPRPERPVGRRAEEYAQQPTQRRTPPRLDGPAPGTGGQPKSAGRPAGSRPSPRTPAPTVPATRAAVRTNASRRPAPTAPGRRLMRQRLAVFVIVTLLVAVFIAAVQGCHRFTHAAGPSGAARTAAPAQHAPGASRG
jgi:hypothetical protein